MAKVLSQSKPREFANALEEMFSIGMPSINILALSEAEATKCENLLRLNMKKYRGEIRGPAREYDPSGEIPLYAIKITRR